MFGHVRKLEILVERDAALARAEAAEADIAHAVAEAKKYAPDYPWGRNTASEAVWALGTGMEGTSHACDEWREKAEAAEAEFKASAEVFAREGQLANAQVQALEAEVGRLLEALKAIANARCKEFTVIGDYVGGEIGNEFAVRLQDMAREALAGSGVLPVFEEPAFKIKADHDAGPLVKRLTEALRELHDEQNGPPLYDRSQQWEAAMARAREVLKESEVNET